MALLRFQVLLPFDLLLVGNKSSRPSESDSASVPRIDSYNVGRNLSLWDGTGGFSRDKEFLSGVISCPGLFGRTAVNGELPHRAAI
jgi:hypothetical protein